MVKLQKHKVYSYKSDNGKVIDHYKHTVVIPENAIQELGWKNGLNLTAVPQDNSLILRPEKEEKKK